MQKDRYWEIDFVRGVTVVLMIFFHAAFQIEFLFGKNFLPDFFSFFWFLGPALIGGPSFIIIAGLSLYIGASKYNKYPSVRPIVKRSGLLFLGGMGITLITYLMDFGGKIYFGILHCLGLCTFISFYFLRFTKYLILVIALLIMALGTYLYIADPVQSMGCLFFWLFPCFCSTLDTMLDYYPVIPWVGCMLLGIFLGKCYYPQGIRSFSSPIPQRMAWLARLMLPIGKHSVLIYFIHTPIIYGILYLLF